MRTVAILAVYLGAIAFGTYQTFGPMIDSGFACTQTERCDGMLNHYILEHSWQVVSNPDYRGSLFSPPCFYPEPHTLWYSEHLLGVAPAYWALRLVMPYDAAYQWWQILMNALNFVAFAAVVRWLGGPHVLAILGGYLWAFALVHLEQLKHQQMIPRFWVPLAAYYAWTFVLTPATRSLNRMLACIFLQSMACVYTGWFLVTGLAVFLPLALTLRRDGWHDLRRFVAGESPGARACARGVGRCAHYRVRAVHPRELGSDAELQGMREADSDAVRMADGAAGHALGPDSRAAGNRVGRAATGVASLGFR